MEKTHTHFDFLNFVFQVWWISIGSIHGNSPKIGFNEMNPRLASLHQLALLKKSRRQDNSCKAAGKVTPSKTGLLPNLATNVKVLRSAGKVTQCMFLFKPEPTVKVWRPVGRVNLNNFWLKQGPKVKVCRPAGRLTRSKLLSKQLPKVKFCSSAGRVTRSKLCSKQEPKVKVCSPAGRVTRSALVKARAKGQGLQSCWQSHAI